MIKSKISFVIIYLLVVFAVLGGLVFIFKDQVFKIEKNDASNSVSQGISQSTLIDNVVINGKKEFLNIQGLDFYIKHEGELTIYCNEKYKESYLEKGFENSNIMTEKGHIIKIGEKIKAIEPFLDGGNGTVSELLILSFDGNLYKISLNNILNNVDAIYKYQYDKKVSSITTGKLQYLDLTKRSLAKLSDDSLHVIGKNNILDDIVKYQLGKKTEIIPLTSKYIVIENDDSVRIGDFKTDKYFSVEEEKWINKDSDNTKYKYLSNMFGLKYKIMDFEYVKTNVTVENNNYDVYNIFYISQEGELLLLKYLLNNLEANNTMIPTSIKTEKPVYKLELDKIGTSKYGIKNIVFTDGTFADFEEIVKSYL